MDTFALYTHTVVFLRASICQTRGIKKKRKKKGKKNKPNTKPALFPLGKAVYKISLISSGMS